MDVNQQIAWEEECVVRGSERYYAIQKRFREHGQIEQTALVSHLFQERLREVAEVLKENSKVVTGRHGAYNSLLTRCVVEGDWLRIAYIGAQAAFHSTMLDAGNTVLKLCLSIGSRLEADLKCRMFEKEHPAYYHTVIKSFASQNVSDYRHKHKVMMAKFSDFDMQWNDWRGEVKVQIGSRVLRALLEVFADVVFITKEWHKGKSTSKLDTTEEFDTWAYEFEKERGFMFPMMLPLKIPPVDWCLEGGNGGGYYTTRMAMPFIKTKGKDHKKWVKQFPALEHRRAVNKLQETAWCVNAPVLRVQQQIYKLGLGVGIPSNEPIRPLRFPTHLENVDKTALTELQKAEIDDWKMLAKVAYGREKQRKGQVLAFMQVQKLAEELVDWPEFYFAYSADFRGRIYCATAGLSPQGADTARGLLRFRSGVVLGANGLRWLAIHGANTFGVDKVSYDERVQWAKDHTDMIREIVADPLSTTKYWGAADKPYQFLAFCFEWEKCDYGKNGQAESHIPVGLDGSCNGLQHFSAMLRDSVGAKATNLSTVDKPQDIYGEVAQVVTKKLQRLDDPRATIWLRVGVTRSCAKRPVMTLPYGATQNSARLYVLDHVRDNWAKFELDESHQWDFANFLTPILWEAIGEVVVAARTAMDWLRRNTGRNYMKWLTPVKFPVYQYYKDMPRSNVVTQLLGTLRLKYSDIDAPADAKATLQKNGISPNFVHSLDSTHLVMTVNAIDLPAFAMIHDDFGTHAGNIDKLFPVIRQTFKQLYTNHDPLKEWAEQNGASIAHIPPRGTYDITDIISADYFFG